MANIKKICGVPFSEFFMSPHYLNRGIMYYPCCPSWLKPPYSGNYHEIIEDDVNGNFNIDDYWNSKKMQEFRRSILDGSYKYCDLETCPTWKSGMLLPLPKEASSIIEVNQTDLVTENALSIITKNQTYLPYPPIKILASIDRACNFMCPTCRNKRISLSNPKTYGRLLKIFNSGARDILFNGSGELFINSQYLKLVREFSSEKYPNIENFDIITNGSSLNKTMWYSLPTDFKRLIRNITVSVDAAHEETYKKIRIGGDFSITKRNLKFISELRKKKEFKEFTLAYVLQKKNIEELPEFIKFAIDLGVDFLLINKVENWTHVTDNYYIDKMKLPLNWKFLFKKKVYEAETLIKESGVKLISNVLNTKNA